MQKSPAVYIGDLIQAHQVCNKTDVGVAELGQKQLHFLPEYLDFL